MTLKDIFYDKLLYILRSICNREAIEEFYNRITGNDNVSIFMDHINRIEDFIDVIDKAKSDNDLFVDLGSLQTQIIQFRTRFSDYNSHFQTSADLILHITERIVQLVQESDEYDYINNIEEINTNEFVFTNVSNALGIDNYFFYDKVNIADAIVLISFDSMIEFKKSLFDEANDAKILTYLLEKMIIQPDSSYIGQFCLYNAIHDGKWERVRTFIELKKVSEGGIIHKNHNIFRCPIVSTLSNIHVAQEYQQFSEAIYILSEYNDKSDILDKYLRIYQVIENFMFKRPICTMIQQNQNRMFSIREFNTLYSKVKENELPSLELLMKEVFAINYSASKTFKDELYDKFYNFVNSSTPEIHALEAFLPLIGVANSSSICILNSVNRGEFYMFLSKLIYKLRCSIVHNKETEFHISHYNFPESIEYLLRNFLFNCLEEIIFFLIINKEPIVTYSIPSLRLY